MKKLFLSLFSIIIFSGIVVAQSTDNCEKFKAIVVAPPEGVDHKLVVIQPDEKIEPKGIVINPCKMSALQNIKIIRAPIPKTNPQISNLFQLSKQTSLNLSQRLPRVVLPLSEATKKLIQR